MVVGLDTETYRQQTGRRLHDDRPPCANLPGLLANIGKRCRLIGQASRLLSTELGNMDVTPCVVVLLETPTPSMAVEIIREIGVSSGRDDLPP